VNLDVIPLVALQEAKLFVSACRQKNHTPITSRENNHV